MTARRLGGCAAACLSVISSTRFRPASRTQFFVRNCASRDGVPLSIALEYVLLDTLSAVDAMLDGASMEANDGCGDGGSLVPRVKRGMRDDTLLEYDVLAVFENSDVLDTDAAIPHSV